MDKKRLNEIKNRIYEAEGLLELMQLRDDKDSELAPMVLARLEESCRLMSKLTETLTSAERQETVTREDEEMTADSEQPVYLVEDDDETPEKPVSPKAAGDADRPNPAFCLNDRFRFRRSLFGGSDAEFNSVMDHVATLSCFDDAEDYFYGDRGLDPEDPDVADFMEIIRNYFA